jgi:hypothetical protein
MSPRNSSKRASGTAIGFPLVRVLGGPTCPLENVRLIFSKRQRIPSIPVLRLVVQ